MHMRKYNYRAARFIMIMLAAFFFACVLHPAASVQAKKLKTYTISPKSKPADKSLLKNKSYNTTTKHYFLLQTYMDKFEKAGGGKLILKKGTYYLNCTVSIPSNVTIILQNGVVLKKTYKNSPMKKSPIMFRFCSPKMHKKTMHNKVKENDKGYKKHNGVKNVKIIGQGNATIDIGGKKKMYAFFMGHNKNCTISGIKFKNLKDGHFIELDAGKNITIENCSFSNLTGKSSKEAINLDTPDVTTGGFNQPWSSMDKTPNEDVTIRNCKFEKVTRAIGTHKYSYGHPHKNITIENCTFKGKYADDNFIIRALNWNGGTIRGCTFRDSYVAIDGPGARDITICNNSFTHNSYRVIYFYPYKGSGQPVIMPHLTSSMTYGNTYSDVGDNVIRNVTGWNSSTQSRIWSQYDAWPLK